jgi:molybdopterin molybdotransferase
MDSSDAERTTGLADARSRLREVCPAHGRIETAPVTGAEGRVLAEAATAKRTVPHYDRAAMDGFAVRAADTVGADGDSPARLGLVDGSVGSGEATRVHTGSPLPEGADTVVRVERADAREGTVEVHERVPEGKDVAPAGEDVEAGVHLFDAGHRLRPSDLALLRATGYRSIRVADRPRVSVVPTGEELVAPGTEPSPGEVVETNGLLVSRLVERWGGSATYRDVVGDDTGALRAAVERDTDHDIVVTTGGSSVGERDLIAGVVAGLGEVLVDGVAVRPGHPVGFGRVEGTSVLMLPGYPVSCLVTAVQLLRPAVAWRSGSEPEPHPTRRGRLAEPLGSKRGKRSFERVVFADRSAVETAAAHGDDTLPEVRPVRKSGAGVMSGVAHADGWVEVSEPAGELPAGEVVEVRAWEYLP